MLIHSRHNPGPRLLHRHEPAVGGQERGGRMCRDYVGRGFARWICLAVWSGYVLFSTVLLVPKKSHVFRWSARLCVRLGVPTNLVAKAFHVLAYAVWGWLAAGALAPGYRRALSRSRVVVCLGGLVLFAVAPEALQALTRFRHPSLLDVGLNLAGGSAALLGRPTDQ